MLHPVSRIPVLIWWNFAAGNGSRVVRTATARPLLRRGSVGYRMEMTATARPLLHRHGDELDDFMAFLRKSINFGRRKCLYIWWLDSEFADKVPWNERSNERNSTIFASSHRRPHGESLPRVAI
ncbi:hypothetical protein QQ045_008583 [Rhodiola kirilowii]